MSTEIWVAIIGALGTIVAALLTVYFTNKKNSHPAAPQNSSSSLLGSSTTRYTSRKLIIGGRQIKVAPGRKTQTINVCDSRNIEGKYEQVYRITGPQNFVTQEFLLQNARTLQDLDRLLMQCGAIPEGPR